ncbi:MAG: LysR family transcriptional regulator [Burkholderiales bacterium]|nr:LysR family transcriptional regulator [Burkholderiales bacterium]
MPQSAIRRYLKHGMLPQLSVFEAVVRLGSFTKAAEELFMAQPTVSVQMKKLAETMGLPLIEQVGKRIQLTDAGRVLHAGCLEMFSTLAAVERSLGDLRGLEAGRLQLAVSTTGEYFAPRMLAEFVRRHPGLDVSLQIQNRSTLLERMSRNLDDLYIFASAPEGRDITVHPLLPNPVVPFAHADHPLAREKNIPFARFAGEPFLIREPGSGARSMVREIFESRGCEPRIRMELSSNEAIKQAIIAGLGVSVMSRYTLGLDVPHEQVAVLDVEGFPIDRPWVIVHPAAKQLSLAARSFLDFMLAESRKLVFDHLSRP